MKTENFVYNRNNETLTFENGEKKFMRESAAIILIDRMFTEYIVDKIGDMINLDPDNEKHYEFNWRLIHILNDPINIAVKKIEELANSDLGTYLKKNHPDYFEFSEDLKIVQEVANDFVLHYLKPFQIIEKRPKMENQLNLF